MIRINYSKPILQLILIILIVVSHTMAADKTYKGVNEQIIHHLKMLEAGKDQANSEYLQMNFPVSFSTTGDSTVYDSLFSGGISGTVYGLDDTTKGSAYVEAIWASEVPPEGPYKGFTYVNEDGSYEISGLAQGNYYVFAGAYNYEVVYYENAPDIDSATPVNVIEDEITPDINFRMQKIEQGTGVISGYITDNQTGEPVSNAFMYAYSKGTRYDYGSARSDSTGFYRIEHLKTGSYTVSAEAEGYLRMLYSAQPSNGEATLVEVTEPNETSNINFALFEGGKISGVVRDHEGNPVPFAYILANTIPLDTILTDPIEPVPADGYGKAIADSLGRYTISGLPTGKYWISAEARQNWQYAVVWYPDASSPEASIPVSVVMGETTENIDLNFPPPRGIGSISGQVLDQNQKPMADIYVAIQTSRDEVDGFYFYHSVRTDSNGRYQFENIPIGSYYISASYESAWEYYTIYWPNGTSFENAEHIELADGEIIENIDFTLEIISATASISGQVTAVDGHPLQNAYISLYPKWTKRDETPYSYYVRAYARSDSAGNYIINDIPIGEYYIQANYWDTNLMGEQWYDMANTEAEATLLVIKDDDHLEQINFKLDIKPIWGEISGTVTDSTTGQPIAGAYVEISSGFISDAQNSFAPWYSTYFAITDEKGNYKIANIFRGEYYISVYANGAFEIYKDAIVKEMAKPVQVIGGETSTIDFDLVPRNDGPCKISGQVTINGMNELINRAVVIARPSVSIMTWPYSERFYSAVTEKDGTYTLSGLPEGEYIVMSFAPWSVYQYFDQVYNYEEATPVLAAKEKETTGIDFNLPLYRCVTGGENWDDLLNTTSINGQVTDKQGTALEGVNITVMNASQVPVAFGKTGVDGRYLINGLSNGDYIIQAGKFGYSSQYNGQTDEISKATQLNFVNGSYELNFQLDESSEYTGIPQINSPEKPKALVLYGNFPNPFNPETKIRFALPEKNNVSIKIFNVLGEQIRNLNQGSLEAGFHQVHWNGTNQTGLPVGSGIYFYQIYVGRQVLRGKMMFIK